MAKARYLCLAESSGDLMTYYILTEPESGKPKVLVRSVIRSRRKHVGTENEHVNNDPAYEDFVFTTDEGQKIVHDADLEDTYVEFPSPLGIPGPQGTPPPIAEGNDTATAGDNQSTTDEGEDPPGEALPADCHEQRRRGSDREGLGRGRSVLGQKLRIRESG